MDEQSPKLVLDFFVLIVDRVIASLAFAFWRYLATLPSEFLRNYDSS